MRLSKWLSDKCYIFLFLLFCGNIYCVISEITYVKREAGVSKCDRFALSLSLGDDCDGNVKGSYYEAGYCQCPFGNANLLCWDKQCVTNQILDQKLNINSDCNGLKLYFEQQGGPYNVFDLNKVPNSTSNFKNVKQIQDQSQDQSCKVGKTDYIEDSNGKLITINSNYFTVDKQNKKLTWQSGSAPNELHGRIIKLTTVNCRFRIGNQWKNNPCIVFKTQGKVNVKPKVAVSTTPSMGSIKPSVSASPQSTKTVSMSSKPTVNPTKTQHVTTTHVSTLVKTSVATTPQPSSTPHVLTTTSTFVPVTSSAIPVNPTKPADNKGRKDEQSAAPIGAIVGPVVGILVIAMIVIVIVLIFFWRRRKQESNSKVKNGQKHKDNPTYGKNETIDLSNHNKDARIPGNELEYDYAAVDGDPRASNGAAPGIYQSLTQDHNRESVYTPLDRQNDPSDIGYNKVERAPFKPARNGPTDPTYNVLERPSDNNDDYLEPGLHIDKNKRPHSRMAPQNDVYQPLDRKSRVFPDDQPVYNVLEGPNPEGEDEPDYNVLEGPNPEGEDEPEYNVLEAPDDQDEPEYNVLEDPDDNYDNAPVEGNKGHPSSHDNVGYASTIDFKQRKGTKNEPVYEAPEGPSSELTYQPLQINGRDDNVYQPLDRTSRVLPDDQPVYHVLESTASEA